MTVPYCVASFILLSSLPLNSFEWTVDSVIRRPQLDRRAIAGIWRLTHVPATKIPMKEFTVYPKKQIPIQSTNDDNGFLLMLREDGSFQQYAFADHEDDEMEHIDGTDWSKSWSDFLVRQKRKLDEDPGSKLFDFVKGVWDYRDGKLMLAADRPEVPQLYVQENVRSRSASVSTAESKDTLLEGELVATYQTPLLENPVLERAKEISQPSLQSSTVDKNGTKGFIDTHLSVPKGSIKIGKFFYPKKHPSFFEQPMFQPVKQGAFALRQVLGSLNTIQAQKENEDVEKFQRSNFYNKTFFLTTHPIGHRLPKGRWSIKYNTFVHDSPSIKAAADAADKESVRNIRVMQVKFFANNTFSSTGGMGTDVILRGKYDVIGEFQDHLWFQVVRFGFGRSVSGSVYSEGRMLSQDDAKSYWGKITLSEKGVNTVDTVDDSSSVNSTRYIEVIGSVMDGWGLEPIPVARFIMRENREVDQELDEDEDDDEDDELENDDGNRLNVDIDGIIETIEDDGISWSSIVDSDTFQ